MCFPANMDDKLQLAIGAAAALAAGYFVVQATKEKKAQTDQRLYLEHTPCLGGKTWEAFLRNQKGWSSTFVNGEMYACHPAGKTTKKGKETMLRVPLCGHIRPGLPQFNYDGGIPRRLSTGV